MSSCRECSATIKFVVMEATGRPLPVEPIWGAGGNVAAKPTRGADGRERLVGYVLSKDHPLRPGYRLYKAHHAECARIRPVNSGQVATAPPPALFDV